MALSEFSTDSSLVSLKLLFSVHKILIALFYLALAMILCEQHLHDTSIVKGTPALWNLSSSETGHF